MKNTYKRFLSLLIIIGVCTCLVPASVFAAENMLRNPGAENGLSGWTVIEAGGEGWSTDFDDIVRNGEGSFQSSFGLGRLSQQVNLLRKTRTTQSAFDSEKPPITFRMYVLARNDQDAQYYFTFKLLDRDGDTVETTGGTYGAPDDLEQLASGSGWVEIEHTFTNYDNGVTYGYFEFGGRDLVGWAGFYGAHFDDAALLVGDFDKGSGQRKRMSLHDRVQNLIKIGNIKTAEELMAQYPKSFSEYFIVDGELIKKTTSTSSDPVLASNTTSVFVRDLEIGMTGDDVRALQEFLISQNSGTAAQVLAEAGASGYFGDVTKQALIEYQIIKGIIPASGYFGSKTKAFMF